MQLPNVVSIYDTTAEKVVASAKTIEKDGVDAVLLSGTGVPTLRAIEQLSPDLKIPVISSNLSLAWWATSKLPNMQPWESISPAVKSLRQWLPAKVKS